MTKESLQWCDALSPHYCRFTALVLAIWVVLISSFILGVSVSNAAPVYWSNTCSGGVMAVLALAQLATLRPAAGRPRMGGL